MIRTILLFAAMIMAGSMTNAKDLYFGFSQEKYPLVARGSKTLHDLSPLRPPTIIISTRQTDETPTALVGFQLVMLGDDRILYKSRDLLENLKQTFADDLAVNLSMDPAPLTDIHEAQIRVAASPRELTYWIILVDVESHWIHVKNSEFYNLTSLSSEQRRRLIQRRVWARCRSLLGKN